MAMKAERSKDGKSLIITLPLLDPPQLSKTGEADPTKGSYTAASTIGFKESPVEIEGVPVFISAHCYLNRKAWEAILAERKANLTAKKAKIAAP